MNKAVGPEDALDQATGRAGKFPKVPGKRSFDMAIALATLILSIPVILLAMVAIRTTSRGPALYSQLRLGQNERVFRCRKLRTMYIETPAVATHETPLGSITPLGRLLRRLKLDELPQLWNVVQGDMSLVGPRPCLPVQLDLIRCRRRLGVFSAQPGITGLSQVRGIDMSDPVLCAETDAEYLRTRSWCLDMGLMLRTVFGFGRSFPDDGRTATEKLPRA